VSTIVLQQDSRWKRSTCSASMPVVDYVGANQDPSRPNRTDNELDCVLPLLTLLATRGSRVDTLLLTPSGGPCRPRRVFVLRPRHCFGLDLFVDLPARCRCSKPLVRARLDKSRPNRTTCLRTVRLLRAQSSHLRSYSSVTEIPHPCDGGAPTFLRSLGPKISSTRR
jgi:hypothetical protein